MSLATHSGQLFQVTIVPLDNCSSQNLFLRSFTNGHLQRGRSLEWTIEYLPQLLQSLISLTDDNRKNKDQNSNKRFALFTLSSFHFDFLHTSLRWSCSFSESPSSLSIVFAQAESFGFLLFVFHRLRINLLSLLSLYQQAWPSSLPELSWTY